ncbi:unnamed protein product [Sphagnum tenellum]
MLLRSISEHFSFISMIFWSISEGSSLQFNSDTYEGCTAADSNIRLPCFEDDGFWQGIRLFDAGGDHPFVYVSLGLKGAPLAVLQISTPPSSTIFCFVSIS